MILTTSLLAACALGWNGGEGSPAAHGPAPATSLPHAVAFVNDDLSHGQLGDGFLSLNEVIQLHNRTLTFAQLSIQEQWQVSGFGLDIAWADIDANAIPVLTVERDLDVIIDFPHGLLVAGINGKPLLDFTQVTNGFVSTSNFVNFRNLIIQGATVGIDLTQTDAIYGTVVEGVEFVGQSVAGLRCNMLTANGSGRLLLERCAFTSAPAGILINEGGANRTTLLFLGGTRMVNVNVGLEVQLGAGGAGTYLLERLEMDTPGNGIRFVRPGGSANRAVTMEATMVRITSGLPFEYSGFPGAVSALTLRMFDLRQTTGTAPALVLGPLGGQITGDIDELKVDGRVEIRTGGTGALTVANARLRNGTTTLAANGTAAIQMVDSRLDNVSLQVQGTAPVTATACCFVGGSLQGSPSAALLVNSSFVGSSVGANVVNSSPLPAAQLGSFAVQPTQPLLGGPLTMQADLPAGFAGLFAMGPTALFPTILPRPIHVYIDIAGVVTLPGVYLAQQSLTFTVPNNPLLAESDWVAQMVVLRDPAAQGPDLSLPPGTRFVLH